VNPVQRPRRRTGSDRERGTGRARLAGL